MKDFFPQSTVEASCWCHTCRKDTFHRILGGRPSACLVCLGRDKRLEQTSIPPEPEQLEIFKP